MWLIRSHSYWPQNYSRVVFGCHVGGSDVISFSRTISPKTTKTTKRDDFGGKWQTSSRKKNATCLRALRCSSFWCAILYKTRQKSVDISTHAHKVGFGRTLCFEWWCTQHPLVWFSTLFALLFNHQRRKRSWKSTLSRKKREQRSRGEAKERYTFLNKIFPYECKGEFFFSLKERQKRGTHTSPLSHTTTSSHVT